MSRDDFGGKKKKSPAQARAAGRRDTGNAAVIDFIRVCFAAAGKSKQKKINTAYEKNKHNLRGWTELVCSKEERW